MTPKEKNIKLLEVLASTYNVIKTEPNTSELRKKLLNKIDVLLKKL